MSYGPPPGGYGPPPGRGQYGPPPGSGDYGTSGGAVGEYGLPAGHGAPPSQRPGPVVSLWFMIAAVALLALILVFSVLTWNTNRAAHNRDVDYTCRTLKYDYDGKVKDELDKRDEITADLYGCDDSDLP